VAIRLSLSKKSRNFGSDPAAHLACRSIVQVRGISKIVRIGSESWGQVLRIKIFDALTLGQSPDGFVKVSFSIFEFAELCGLRQSHENDTSAFSLKPF
jgi:hypothetical protein